MKERVDYKELNSVTIDEDENASPTKNVVSPSRQSPRKRPTTPGKDSSPRKVPKMACPSPKKKISTPVKNSSPTKKSTTPGKFTSPVKRLASPPRNKPGSAKKSPGALREKVDNIFTSVKSQKIYNLVSS